MSKKRPLSHVIDDRGVRLLHNLIPEDWIIRELPKDYGVDFEIELVRDGIVLGQRVWAQLKTTSKVKRKKHRFTLRPSVVELGGATDHVVESVVFPYAIEDIEYANSCPFPLLLFVADLSTQDIFWAPISRSVEYSIGGKLSKTKGHHPLYLPLWTSFIRESASGWHSLEWMSFEMQRSYALNRISNLYHGYLNHHAPDLAFATAPFAETGLRISLERLRDVLDFVLLQDCLFDEQIGVPWFVGNELTRSVVGPSFRDKFYLAQQTVSKLLPLVGTGCNDSTYLTGLYQCQQAVSNLGIMIYSFEGFMAHYVFSKVSAGVHACQGDDPHEQLASAFAQMMPLEPPNSALPGSWGDALRGVSL